MEKRLKKQRNRLFLRVTAILLAVWLAVSVTYCFIRLYSEKADLKSRSFSDLSYAKQSITLGEDGIPLESKIYINDYNLLSFKNLIEGYSDVQLLVMNPDTGKVLADTSNKTDVCFSLRTEKGSYPDYFGYVDFLTVRGRLKDSQYGRIVELLNETPADGKSYELVCTVFYIVRGEFIPLELSVVLTDSPDCRADQCETAEVFACNDNVPDGVTVYRNSEYRINTIPKQFFLDERNRGDLISLIDDTERKKNVSAISLGGAEYIFYSSEYYYLDAYLFSEAADRYVNFPKIYCLQYARRANLLDSCMNALAGGVAAIFGFFFVIGVIICVMIWNTVRAQIVQEQKRLDLTSALAHDIKTPLFVISGYAYSLKEDIDSDDRDSYLDKIILQTEQINALVHKMLNLSKLDSFSMTLNRSEFDLFLLVQEILEDCRSLPDGKSVALTRNGSNMINADKELICTALQNLIENAVKYSPEGSKITLEVTDKTVRISNPSQPISKAELKKIWEPYYRVDKSRHKKGNGLGLSIVKSILDLHGAKYDMTMKDGCMVFQADF